MHVDSYIFVFKGEQTRMLHSYSVFFVCEFFCLWTLILRHDQYHGKCNNFSLVPLTVAVNGLVDAGLTIDIRLAVLYCTLCSQAALMLSLVLRF